MKTQKFQHRRDCQSHLIIALRFELNGMFNDAGGRLRHLTLFKGRTVSIARQIVRPKNPQTSSQIKTRSYFTTNTTGWRALSQADQTSWINAALEHHHSGKINYKYNSTGAAYYSAVNNTANFFNIFPPITTPPPLTPPTNNGDIDNIFSGSTPTPALISIDIPLVSSGDLLCIYATQCFSFGVNTFKGKYRPIKICVAGAAQTAYDITAEYIAVFGTPIVGQKFSFRCRRYNIAGGSPIKYWGESELSGKVR